MLIYWRVTCGKTIFISAQQISMCQISHITVRPTGAPQLISVGPPWSAGPVGVPVLTPSQRAEAEKKTDRISHRIHGAGIYANWGHIDGIHVTIYSSTMDPMGLEDPQFLQLW